MPRRTWLLAFAAFACGTAQDPVGQKEPGAEHKTMQARRQPARSNSATSGAGGSVQSDRGGSDAPGGGASTGGAKGTGGAKAPEGRRPAAPQE